MKKLSAAILLIVACMSAGAADSAKTPTTIPAAQPPQKVFVVVFDLAGGDLGKVISDSLRLRLRRDKGYEVIDRLTTREFSAALSSRTKPAKVIGLMKSLACNVAVYGSVHSVGPDIRVEARCIDLRKPANPDGWAKVFTDSTERSKAIVARQITEAIRGQLEWVPPQYGDEAEPEKFAKPLNVNGDFERGRLGWDAPDNVSTFIEKGPSGRGKVLRVQTDLKRDPWLAYRRKLRFGRADPTKPPKIGKDTSYGSVAGLEGVHYRSQWIKATVGRRYWLLADCAGRGGAKVFVKGFKDWSAQADGLPESSLVELGITPEKFAALPLEQRKKLIAEDAKKNPARHRRECYRWYLNCAESKRGEWMHFAAPFPPRGGLPGNVQWLQIQIYSYWPPGEYLWDNVLLYADPNQKAPIAEEPARTSGSLKLSAFSFQHLGCLRLYPFSLLQTNRVCR